jgi:hypothetical protein
MFMFGYDTRYGLWQYDDPIHFSILMNRTIKGILEIAPSGRHSTGHGFMQWDAFKIRDRILYFLMYANLAILH